MLVLSVLLATKINRISDRLRLYAIHSIIIIYRREEKKSIDRAEKKKKTRIYETNVRENVRRATRYGVETSKTNTRCLARRH